MDKTKKVAVGLSGGVDSSVAAALLKEKGYDVVGITMEIFEGPAAVETTSNHACYGPDEKEDIEIAASICKKLKIPYFVFDLKNEYKNHVISYFKNEYLSGRTPNPCVVCNKHKETPATVFPHGKDKIRVLFKEPQMSVAPGQSAVFYSGNTAVGGGIIQHSL